MEWEEPDGRPRPSPRPVPYRCKTAIELMFILLEVVGLLVMVVEVVEVKTCSPRYLAQSSLGQAVKKTLSVSRGRGTNMSGLPMW